MFRSHSPRFFGNGNGQLQPKVNQKPSQKPQQVSNPPILNSEKKLTPTSKDVNRAFWNVCSSIYQVMEPQPFATPNLGQVKKDFDLLRELEKEYLNSEQQTPPPKMGRR